MGLELARLVHISRFIADTLIASDVTGIRDRNTITGRKAQLHCKELVWEAGPTVRRNQAGVTLFSAK